MSHLRGQRCHAEPQALLQVKVPFLVVVFVLLHVVLVAVGAPAVEDPHEDAKKRYISDST